MALLIALRSWCLVPAPPASRPRRRPLGAGFQGRAMICTQLLLLGFGGVGPQRPGMQEFWLPPLPTSEPGVHTACPGRPETCSRPPRGPEKPAPSVSLPGLSTLLFRAQRSRPRSESQRPRGELPGHPAGTWVPSPAREQAQKNGDSQSSCCRVSARVVVGALCPLPSQEMRPCKSSRKPHLRKGRAMGGSWVTVPRPQGAVEK